MNTRYEILPDIYIGHRETVNDKLANQICKVSQLIDADKLFNFVNVSKSYNDKSIKKNMEKYEIDKAIEVLINTSKKINNNVKNNICTLVICNNVDQFSPSVACAYLMIYGKMRLIDAVKIVKSKKINVFSSGIYFSIALNRIESRI